MTITAQRLLEELGHRAWSGFNSDDMVFTSEDSNQAKTELNFALRYLVNLEDFPFRSKEKTFKTSANMSEYNMVDGQINAIYNIDTLEKLDFIGSGDDLNKEETGKPTSYWINYKNPNQKIRLYPTPDTNYNYKIIFNQYKPILTQDGEALSEFENADDIINIPEHLEYLFMDCLVLRVMATNNKDEQDENYNPTLVEFNEAWRVFKKACNPVRVDARAVF